MRLATFVLLPLAILALGGCGSTPPTPPPAPGPSADEGVQKQREAEAADVLRQLEPQLAQWRSLPPDQRDDQGRAFGPILERTLAQVSGTSSENKVLLWLADWRLHYNGGVGVLPCLDRLAAARSLKVKKLGERLRVEYLVRVGDLRQARERAERLVAEIPEFQPLLMLISLHERIGSVPPRTAGVDITGGPDDPASGRAEPYLLYCFAEVLDPENLYWFQLFLTEAARPEYAGRLRVVLVTSEGTPLSTAAKVRDLPGSQLLDVLWASPGADGQEQAWRSAWQLAEGQRAAVVLGAGPKRLILDVPTEPENLRVLLPHR